MLVVLTVLTRSPASRSLIAYLAAYLVIGYDILKKAGKGILNGRAFDENFLMAHRHPRRVLPRHLDEERRLC